MVGFLLLLLFFLLILYDNRSLLVRWYTFRQRAIKCLNQINGPPAIPILGSAYLFKWNVMEFSHQVEEWGRRYLLSDVSSSGGLMKAWVGPVPLVACGTHESIKVILDSNSLLSKPQQYDILGRWLGKGLVLRTGDNWHSRRKLLTPAFHFNILRRYLPVFGERVEEMLIDVDKYADGHQIVDLFPLIKRCSLMIITETAMGIRLESGVHTDEEYINAIYRLSQIAWDFLRFPWLWLKPIWKLSGYQDEFDCCVKKAHDFTLSVIVERREILHEEGLLDENVSEDQIRQKKLALLDLLLLMQKANALTDEDLRAEVDTFMFEGSDTNASAISFTVWWLGQYPEYQEKVFEEVQSIFGSDKRCPTEDDIARMSFIEKCYKEALRIFPPVPIIARKLTQDVEISGRLIPEGMTVVVSPLSTHRDPRCWERPEEFYPYHFDADKQAARDAFAFIPFSAGPRNCIGQKFAILEAKSILAQIFRSYRVESVDHFPDNRPLPEIILKPSKGIRVKLYRR